MDKLLRHPVIAAVIAAGIVSIASTFFGWWEAIWNAIKAAGGFATTDVALPLWLVVVLVLLAIFVLALPLYALLERKVQEDWRNYTTDEFYGIRWRWGYFSGGTMKDPVPFCVRCDFQIRPHSASAYAVVDRWEYRCENCGHVGITIEESLGSFEDRVARQIQRKIRAGEWKITQQNA